MKLTHFRFGSKVTSILRKVVIILKFKFRVNFKCLTLFCYMNEKKNYSVHVHMLDFHHLNEKLAKLKKKKKNPSLIFDIFRDGKVSFAIKKTIICIVPKTPINFVFTLSYFEYF
jgi:hypothetical protein